MADDSKPSLKPQGAEPLPRPRPPVAEREPLTITVIEPAPAPAPVTVAQPVKIEAPPPIRLWRPSNLGLLFLLAGVLLFTLYRLQVSPLIQRFEHGVERRVFGERSYEAHRDPHSRFDQAPRAHEDQAHR